MSTHYVKMEGSEQERQLLEVLRDHEGDATSDFRLLVQRQDGAWSNFSGMLLPSRLMASRTSLGALRLCHGGPTMVQ